MPDPASTVAPTAAPTTAAAQPAPTANPAVDEQVAAFAARERKFTMESRRAKEQLQQERTALQQQLAEWKSQQSSVEADRAALAQYKQKIAAGRNNPRELFSLLGEDVDQRQIVTRLTEDLLNGGEATPESKIQQLEQALKAQRDEFQNQFKTWEQQQQEAMEQAEKAENAENQRRAQLAQQQQTQQDRIFEQGVSAMIRANANDYPLTSLHNLGPNVAQTIRAHYERTAQNSENGIGEVLDEREAAADFEKRLEADILKSVESLPSLKSKISALLSGKAQPMQSQTAPVQTQQTNPFAPTLNNGMTAATPSRALGANTVRQRQANLVAKLSGKALPYPDVA